MKIATKHLIVIAVFGALIGLGIALTFVFTSSPAPAQEQQGEYTPRDIMERFVADWNEGGPDKLTDNLTRTGYKLEKKNLFVADYVVDPVPTSFNFEDFTRDFREEMQKAWCDDDVKELRDAGAISVHRFATKQAEKLGEFRDNSKVCGN